MYSSTSSALVVLHLLGTIQSIQYNRPNVEEPENSPSPHMRPTLVLWISNGLPGNTPAQISFTTQGHRITV
ncbi:hypothetical protein F5B21DRAFT_480925 [Xylaria acuta]|nr:hypothetical protein F5B21DRAFT_480925 [Xylaria acuta]